MGKKLYVGNLAYGVNDQELSAAFSAFGNVASAKVITDRESGRSKGFGFVEMSTDDEAQGALSNLNGTDLSGRALNISEARPQEPRTGGFGGGQSRGRY